MYCYYENHLSSIQTVAILTGRTLCFIFPIFCILIVALTLNLRNCNSNLFQVLAGTHDRGKRHFL